jgi:hypothetical protein
VLHYKKVAAQAARIWEAPLGIIAGLLTALHDSYRPWWGYGRQSDPYSGECADICRDCVKGADGVLRVVSCDDRVTVLCQGRVQVARSMVLVWTPHVLDRSCAVAYCSRCSNC